MALFPSYAVFFDELIYISPDILPEHSENLKKLCVKMVQMRIDQSFFLIVGTIFEKLNVNDLKSSGWLNFAVQSVLMVISQAPPEPENQVSYRNLYFKEFVIHFMKFGLKNGFEGRVILRSEYLSEIERVQTGGLQIIFSFQPIHQFVQFFKLRPDVKLITYGMAKLVMESTQAFANSGAMNAWQLLFSSLIRNFFNRKSSLKSSIRDGYNRLKQSNQVHMSSESLQNRAIRDIKELGDTSGFYRLACFPIRLDTVTEQSRKLEGDDVLDCMQNIRAFLSSTSSKIDFNFLDSDLKAFIDSSN